MPPTPDVVGTNPKYRGWNMNAERMFLADSDRTWSNVSCAPDAEGRT